MTTDEFDIYIKKNLDLKSLHTIDNSLNGLQVISQHRDVQKAAFAVDASLESFRRAVAWHANLLFVHHGLLWKTDQSITGLFYKRLKFLIDHDLALYAVHLPLDIHPLFGNNIVLANTLNLERIQPFCEYHGTSIGWRGCLPQSSSIDDIERLICGGKNHNLGILRFGPEKITTVGIVSGRASNAIHQALELGLDLVITGEASHTVYHESLEGRLHVLFAGHYSTEIGGVKELSTRVAAETDIVTTFIDVPTGL